MNFNKLVAYGCSHTAGSESIDHLVLDKIAESTEERLVKINQIKKSFNQNFKLFYTTYYTSEYSSRIEFWKENQEKEEKRRTWVRYLAEELNIPFVNQARSGCSFDYNIYTLMHDIKRGLIDENTLVVIAVPELARWMYFRDNHSLDPVPVLFHRWSSEEFDDNFKNTFIDNIATETHLMWNYARNMFYLQALSQKYTIKVFFTSLPEYLNYYYRTSQVETVKELFQESLNSSIVLKGMKPLHDRGMQTYGFGHPTEQEQILIASELLGKLNDL